MGFGFNLAFIFIVCPLAMIIALLWLISRKKIFGILLLVGFLGLCSLIALSALMEFINARKVLTRQDIYGEYVIDRPMFKGKQADWQYDHFKLELTPQNKFNFYLLDNGKVIKAYNGNISFNNNYTSPRLGIQPDSPVHHIISGNPTLYRGKFSYYYVFESAKFGNVFFKKGKWKPIE
ncbi:hypothetical protein D0C36_09710 [Mucilaginibacter conchicola]|uniref:Uncharacterized protein n=2 Tax=Mucilaginibacter conchicola TaxID=2303333 RepID=A0A372NT07_9SPHI|nr:hypothetical protein D0C36_09710 [Mucilaginibacter conchicola]